MPKEKEERLKDSRYILKQLKCFGHPVSNSYVKFQYYKIQSIENFSKSDVYKYARTYKRDRLSPKKNQLLSRLASHTINPQSPNNIHFEYYAEKKRKKNRNKLHPDYLIPCKSKKENIIYQPEVSTIILGRESAGKSCLLQQLFATTMKYYDDWLPVYISFDQNQSHHLHSYQRNVDFLKDEKSRDENPNYLWDFIIFSLLSAVEFPLILYDGDNEIYIEYEYFSNDEKTSLIKILEKQNLLIFFDSMELLSVKKLSYFLFEFAKDFERIKGRKNFRIIHTLSPNFLHIAMNSPKFSQSSLQSQSNIDLPSPRSKNNEEKLDDKNGTMKSEENSYDFYLHTYDDNYNNGETQNNKNNDKNDHKIGNDNDNKNERITEDNQQNGDSGTKTIDLIAKRISEEFKVLIMKPGNDFEVLTQNCTETLYKRWEKVGQNLLKNTLFLPSFEKDLSTPDLLEEEQEVSASTWMGFDAAVRAHRARLLPYKHPTPLLLFLLSLRLSSPDFQSNGEIRGTDSQFSLFSLFDDFFDHIVRNYFSTHQPGAQYPSILIETYELNISQLKLFCSIVGFLSHWFEFEVQRSFDNCFIKNIQLNDICNDISQPNSDNNSNNNNSNVKYLNSSFQASSSPSPLNANRRKSIDRTIKPKTLISILSHKSFIKIQLKNLLSKSGIPGFLGFSLPDDEHDDSLSLLDEQYDDIFEEVIQILHDFYKISEDGYLICRHVMFQQFLAARFLSESPTFISMILECFQSNYSIPIHSMIERSDLQFNAMYQELSDSSLNDSVEIGADDTFFYSYHFHHFSFSRSLFLTSEWWRDVFSFIGIKKGIYWSISTIGLRQDPDQLLNQSGNSPSEYPQSRGSKHSDLEISSSSFSSSKSSKNPRNQSSNISQSFVRASLSDRSSNKKSTTLKQRIGKASAPILENKPTVHQRLMQARGLTTVSAMAFTSTSHSHKTIIDMFAQKYRMGYDPSDISLIQFQTILRIYSLICCSRSISENQADPMTISISKLFISILDHSDNSAITLLEEFPIYTLSSFDVNTSQIIVKKLIQMFYSKTYSLEMLINLFTKLHFSGYNQIYIKEFIQRYNSYESVLRLSILFILQNIDKYSYEKAHVNTILYSLIDSDQLVQLEVIRIIRKLGNEVISNISEHEIEKLSKLFKGGIHASINSSVKFLIDLLESKRHDQLPNTSTDNLFISHLHIFNALLADNNIGTRLLAFLVYGGKNFNKDKLDIENGYYARQAAFKISHTLHNIDSSPNYIPFDSETISIDDSEDDSLVPSSYHRNTQTHSSSSSPSYNNNNSNGNRRSSINVYDRRTTTAITASPTNKNGKWMLKSIEKPKHQQHHTKKFHYIVQISSEIGATLGEIAACWTSSVLKLLCYKSDLIRTINTISFRDLTMENKLQFLKALLKGKEENVAVEMQVMLLLQEINPATYINDEIVDFLLSYFQVLFDVTISLTLRKLIVKLCIHLVKTYPNILPLQYVCDIILICESEFYIDAVTIVNCIFHPSNMTYSASPSSPSSPSSLSPSSYNPLGNNPSSPHNANMLAAISLLLTNRNPHFDFVTISAMELINHHSISSKDVLQLPILEILTSSNMQTRQALIDLIGKIPHIFYRFIPKIFQLLTLKEYHDLSRSEFVMMQSVAISALISFLKNAYHRQVISCFFKILLENSSSPSSSSPVLSTDDENNAENDSSSYISSSSFLTHRRFSEANLTEETIIKQAKNLSIPFIRSSLMIFSHIDESHANDPLKSFVIHCVSHLNLQVRLLAIECLAAFGIHDLQSFQIILKNLSNNEDPEIRNTCHNVLKSFRLKYKKGVFPMDMIESQLIKLSEIPSFANREASISLLHFCNDKRFRKYRSYVLQLTTDPNKNIRMSAIHLLYSIIESKVISHFIPTVIHMLNNDVSPIVRKKCLKFLSSNSMIAMNVVEIASYIITRKDEVLEMRLQAMILLSKAENLNEHFSAAIVEIIITYGSDPSAMYRFYNAVFACGYPLARIIPKIISCLKSSQFIPQKRRLLRFIHPFMNRLYLDYYQCYPYVIAMATDPDLYVKLTSFKLLRKMACRLPESSASEKISSFILRTIINEFGTFFACDHNLEVKRVAIKGLIQIGKYHSHKRNSILARLLGTHDGLQFKYSVWQQISRDWNIVVRKPQ